MFAVTAAIAVIVVIAIAIVIALALAVAIDKEWYITRCMSRDNKPTS
jgi:hypothetical protein